MAIVQRTPHTGAWVGPLVGRRLELEAARQVVADLSKGPANLVLEGPAGIGKSTIWSAALGQARTAGATVLVSRPSTGDAGVPWAGLSDILAAVPAGAVAGLPDPQRHALEVALSRREPGDTAVDELSVRLATHAVLEALAAEAPVVIAIDDLQWLDAASTGVLAHTMRRATPTRIGLIATYRTAAGDPLADHGQEAALLEVAANELVGAIRDGAGRRIEVGPLADDPLRAIVRDQVGAHASRSRVDELCRVSGGNPLYALELARALASEPAGGSPEGDDVPTPAGLRALVEARFADLPDGARELAVVIATAGPLAWEDALALADGEISLSDLDATMAAGFLATAGGLISTTHPLLDAIVQQAASEPRRRRIHAAFAARWPTSDETPRHLAAAATGPDPAVAGALDQAADRARRRGAPRVAGSLFESAARLTPPADLDDRARREIEAALAHFAGGETDRARLLLEGVAATSGGARRAEALTRLATVVWAADGDRAAAEAFARALPAAAGDPAAEGDIHDNLAWLTCWLGDMPRAFDHVRIAREQAEQVGDPALLARVLDKYGQIEFQTGRSSGLDATARAIELESTVGTVGEASADRTTLLFWSDRLDEARAEALDLLHRVVAEGNERVRPDFLARLGIIETRAGNWPQARAYLAEALELATVAGLAVGGIRRPLGYLQAVDGSSEEALALVDEMLPASREQGAAWNVVRLLLIAGSTHLALGNVQLAADRLDEADQICERIGVVEPGIFRVGADAVEALVAADRLDRAEAVLGRFERDSKAVGRPWGVAGSTRGRALVESANGNQEAALVAAAEAVQLSEALNQPFELGRALLVAGTIERRAGRRREARTHLAGAVEIFERLGARPWTARAEAELGRISGRAPASNALTPTEERVTALVVDGLTNQEVAARLFVTVRTVETNLTRIYQKLEVRSRTELARRVASGREAPAEPAAAGVP